MPPKNRNKKKPRKQIQRGQQIGSSVTEAQNEMVGDDVVSPSQKNGGVMIPHIERVKIHPGGIDLNDIELKRVEDVLQKIDVVTFEELQYCGYEPLECILARCVFRTDDHPAVIKYASSTTGYTQYDTLINIKPSHQQAIEFDTVSVPFKHALLHAPTLMKFVSQCASSKLKPVLGLYTASTFDLHIPLSFSLFFKSPTPQHVGEIPQTATECAAYHLQTLKDNGESETARNFEPLPMEQANVKTVHGGQLNHVTCFIQIVELAPALIDQTQLITSQRIFVSVVNLQIQINQVIVIQSACELSSLPAVVQDGLLEYPTTCEHVAENLTATATSIQPKLLHYVDAHKIESGVIENATICSTVLYENVFETLSVSSVNIETAVISFIADGMRQCALNGNTEVSIETAVEIMPLTPEMGKVYMMDLEVATARNSVQEVFHNPEKSETTRELIFGTFRRLRMVKSVNVPYTSRSRPVPIDHAAIALENGGDYQMALVNVEEIHFNEGLENSGFTDAATWLSGSLSGYVEYDVTSIITGPVIAQAEQFIVSNEELDQVKITVQIVFTTPDVYMEGDTSPIVSEKSDPFSDGDVGDGQSFIDELEAFMDAESESLHGFPLQEFHDAKAQHFSDDQTENSPESVRHSPSPTPTDEQKVAHPSHFGLESSQEFKVNLSSLSVEKDFTFVSPKVTLENKSAEFTSTTKFRNPASIDENGDLDEVAVNDAEAVEALLLSRLELAQSEMAKQELDASRVSPVQKIRSREFASVRVFRAGPTHSSREFKQSKVQSSTEFSQDQQRSEGEHTAQVLTTQVEIATHRPVEAVRSGYANLAGGEQPTIYDGITINDSNIWVEPSNRDFVDAQDITGDERKPIKRFDTYELPEINTSPIRSSHEIYSASMKIQATATLEEDTSDSQSLKNVIRAHLRSAPDLSEETAVLKRRIIALERKQSEQSLSLSSSSTVIERLEVVGQDKLQSNVGPVRTSEVEVTEISSASTHSARGIGIETNLEMSSNGVTKSREDQVEESTASHTTSVDDFHVPEVPEVPEENKKLTSVRDVGQEAIQQFAVNDLKPVKVASVVSQEGGCEIFQDLLKKVSEINPPLTAPLLEKRPYVIDPKIMPHIAAAQESLVHFGAVQQSSSTESISEVREQLPDINFKALPKLISIKSEADVQPDPMLQRSQSCPQSDSSASQFTRMAQFTSTTNLFDPSTNKWVTVNLGKNMANDATRSLDRDRTSLKLLSSGDLDLRESGLNSQESEVNTEVNTMFDLKCIVM